MIKSRKPSLPLWVKGAFFVEECARMGRCGWSDWCGDRGLGNLTNLEDLSNCARLSSGYNLHDNPHFALRVNELPWRSWRPWRAFFLPQRPRSSDYTFPLRCRSRLRNLAGFVNVTHWFLNTFQKTKLSEGVIIHSIAGPITPSSPMIIRLR